MDLSNQIILVGGVLSLLAVFAGIASVRLGAPVLLGLIIVGMLAGEDGPGEGVGGGQRLFDIVFVAVIISVALQGPTLNAAARMLDLRGEERIAH